MFLRLMHIIIITSVNDIRYRYNSMIRNDVKILFVDNVKSGWMVRDNEWDRDNVLFNTLHFV